MVYSKKWQSQFTPNITVIGLTPRADSIKIFGVHLLSSKSFITMEKSVNRYTIACLKKRVYVLQKKFKRLALSYIEARREQKVLFLSHQVTRHTTFFIGTIILNNFIDSKGYRTSDAQNFGFVNIRQILD
jgi:hypothetical protein